MAKPIGIGLVLEGDDTRSSSLALTPFRLTSHHRATLFAVYRELIQLYWSIGCDVFNKQKNEGWGSKIVDRLASYFYPACISVGK